MSDYDETVMFGPSVQQLALAEGSGATGLECSRETALDFQTEVEAMVEQVRRLSRDKPRHFAAGARELRLLLDEIQTDKAPPVVDKIQMEKKMDKAPVVDGEVNKIQMDEKMNKAPVVDETGREALVIQTDSEAPAGKYRLAADGEYVRSILAMPKEEPCRIPFSKPGNKAAKLLGITEECLEKKRQRYRDAAAATEGMCDEFALFQEKVREQSDRLGYFEVDDEYLDGVEELQDFCEELRKERPCRVPFQFYDPDRCKPAEEPCSVK